VKGYHYDFARNKGTGRTTVFGVSDDATHREHRRKTVVAFGNKVSAYEPVIKTHVEALIARVRLFMGEDRIVALSSLLHRFQLNALFEVIFGRELHVPLPPPGEEDTLSQGFHTTSGFIFTAAWLPWLSWILNTSPVQSFIQKPKYQADGSLLPLSKFFLTAAKIITVEHPPPVLNSKTQPSILQNYLAVPGDDSRHMGISQIAIESLNLIFAGQGSTTAALTSILWQLGTPEGIQWQRKIRDLTLEMRHLRL